MKTKTLAELADMVGAELVGDPNIIISGVNDLEGAGPGQITFIADVKHSESLAKTQADAVIAPQKIAYADKPLLKVRDPYLAVAIIHNFFLKEEFVASGVHPSAVVGEECLISQEVSIGPGVVIGNHVQIGERVKLHPGVVLDDNVVLGDDVVLHANVKVYANCQLGSRILVHSGTVIGSDGFGFATDENGRHIKRPHVGIVQIDDDVEIGANVTIDRGTFGKTWIQQGVMIDNLVQLGHNVVIGAGSILVAQVGVAGSTTTGRGVVMGGQVGVGGHVHIGDRSMIAAKSGVHNNLEPGSIMAGIPAIPHKKWLRASAAYAKLPEMVKELRSLRKQVAQLTEQLASHDDEQ